MNQRISGRLYKYAIQHYQYMFFINVNCMTQDILSNVSMQRILSVQYAIPDSVLLSRECLELISRIFVPEPSAVSFLFFLLLYSFRYIVTSPSITLVDMSNKIMGVSGYQNFFCCWSNRFQTLSALNKSLYAFMCF